MFSDKVFKNILLPAVAMIAIAGFLLGGQWSVDKPVDPFVKAIYLGEFSDKLDLENVNDVFNFVFSKLDSEVNVYPSENYYYFSFLLNGRETRGNIRLSPGKDERDGGYLNFGYREFDQKSHLSFQRKLESSLNYKKFGSEDGLALYKQASGGPSMRLKQPYSGTNYLYSSSRVEPSREVTISSDLKYEVGYGGKKVVFNLSNLDQSYPDYVGLRDGEEFLMRTQDESGLKFLLIFNKKTRDFLWILDEEENQILNIPATSFKNIEGGIPLRRDKYQNFELDERTAFAFYNDEKNNRKVLIGVYVENIKNNSYFDGPFDQLADNFIDETWNNEEGLGFRVQGSGLGKAFNHVAPSLRSVPTIASGGPAKQSHANILDFKDYIELTYPYIRGRIDEYGHLLGENGKVLTTRVAITPYYIYESLSDLEEFVGKCAELEEEEKRLSCLVHDYKKE